MTDAVNLNKPMSWKEARDAYVKGVPIVLPTMMMEVRIRPLDVSTFITEEQFSDTLGAFVQRFIDNPSPLATLQTAAAIEQCFVILNNVEAMPEFKDGEMHLALQAYEDKLIREAGDDPQKTLQVESLQPMITELIALCDDAPGKTLQELRNRLTERMNEVRAGEGTDFLDLIRTSRAVFERFAMRAIAEPKLVVEAKNEDEFPIRDISYEDLQFVWGLKNLPLLKLRRFSEEQSQYLESLSSQPTEPPPTE